MIRITCGHCQKPLSIDESKLPMREVTFPCPLCRQSVRVDRRELEAGAAPAPPAAPGPVSEEGPGEPEHEVGDKALLVGVDDPAVRHAARLIGFLPLYFGDLNQARELYMQEFPRVVFIHPQQLTPPPLESFAAIVSLSPSDRRRSFFILVSDSLRTFDGNAAFLYGVNLVVAKKDLSHFPDIYREARAAHDRLYAGMYAVERERQRSH